MTHRNPGYSGEQVPLFPGQQALKGKEIPSPGEIPVVVQDDERQQEQLGFSPPPAEREEKRVGQRELGRWGDFLNSLISLARNFYQFEPRAGQPEASFFDAGRLREANRLAGLARELGQGDVLSDLLKGRYPSPSDFFNKAREILGNDLLVEFDRRTKEPDED